MSINLCSEHLLKNNLITLDCSQVSSDNHSVNNLISNDIRLRRLGFRTESFVRPPIEITLKSKFRFDLKQLEIGLKLNDNKTDSFEIYSSKESEDFQLISKQFNCKTDSVVLRNVCFRPNSILRQLNLIPEECQTNNSSEVLVIKCFKNCFQINSIKIKILRTTNSSIGCLGYLKIFVQPVRQTNSDILDKIRELFSNNLSLSKSVSKSFSFYNSTEDQNEEQNRNKFSENQWKRKYDSIKSQTNDEIIVPEEFIDKITNEVMIDPILLPSGHSVDKTTLDKYLSEESKWCRPPSDPFTQLLFTSERQPKPNFILRQRIDEFLSQTCNQSTDERLESSNKRRIVGFNCVNNKNKLISSKLLTEYESIGSQQTSSSNKQLLNSRQLCVGCNKSHSNDDSIVLYKLLCNHLICRTKLIENQNLKQIICNQCKCQTITDKVIKLNRI